MIKTCYLPWMNNPYVTLYKPKQKISAEKNITDTPSAQQLDYTEGTSLNFKPLNKNGRNTEAGCEDVDREGSRG